MTDDEKGEHRRKGRGGGEGGEVDKEEMREEGEKRAEKRGERGRGPWSGTEEAVTSHTQGPFGGTGKPEPLCASVPI